jgi:hypothetical protein
MDGVTFAQAAPPQSKESATKNDGNIYQKKYAHSILSHRSSHTKNTQVLHFYKQAYVMTLQ